MCFDKSDGNQTFTVFAKASSGALVSACRHSGVLGKAVSPASSTITITTANPLTSPKTAPSSRSANPRPTRLIKPDIAFASKVDANKTIRKTARKPTSRRKD